MQSTAIRPDVLSGIPLPVGNTLVGDLGVTDPQAQAIAPASVEQVHAGSSLAPAPKSGELSNPQQPGNEPATAVEAI